jgi:inorganic pyrophosphatase
LFAKDDSAHSKVNSLKHLYHDFLEELQQSVETFKKQKAEILERKVANDKKVLKE